MRNTTDTTKEASISEATRHSIDSGRAGSGETVTTARRKVARKVQKGQDFEQRNRELFRERAELKDQLESSLDKETLTNVQRRRTDRTRRQLDALTFDIYETNYGLVRSVVKKFTSHSSPEDAADYESAGVVGLMRAIETFDPEKGTFSAWAWKPIQREVLRAVRSNEFRSLNSGDFERRPRILNAERTLSEKFGRTPTVSEVAEEAGVTHEQARRVIFEPTTSSLNVVVSSDGAAAEVGDLVEADEADIADRMSASAFVSSLASHGISALSERELYVLTRRFGLDDEPAQNLSTIGEDMGLSREAVRQIECKALARLQHPAVLRKILFTGNK